MKIHKILWTLFCPKIVKNPLILFLFLNCESPEGMYFCSEKSFDPILFLNCVSHPLVVTDLHEYREE